MSAFCTQCGVELRPSARFCEQCGAPVEKRASTSTHEFPEEKRIWRRVLAIGGGALLAGLLLVVVLYTIGSAPVAARFIPADSVLYAEVTDISETVQYVESILHEVSGASPEALKSDMRNLLRTWETSGLSEALRHVRSLHLCIVDLRLPALLEGAEGLVPRREQDWLPGALLFADLAPSARGSDFFEDRWLPQLKAKLAPQFRLVRSDLHGTPLYEFGTRQLSIFATFFRSYLVLSPQRELLGALIDRSWQDGESLADDPHFLRAHAYRPPSGVFAYINVIPMWPKLDELLVLVTGQHEAARVVRELRLQDIKSLAVGVHQLSDALRLTAHLQIDPDNPAVRATRQSARPLNDLLSEIPADVTHATLLSIDDPVEAWRKATSLLLRLEAIAGEDEIRKALVEAETELGQVGLDLERDLLGSLGHTAALLSWTGELSGLLFESASPSRVKSTLHLLEEAVLKEGTRVRRRELDGFTIHYLGDVAYTTWDDYVLIGTRHAFKRVVASLAAKRTLGADPTLRRLMATLPSRSGSGTVTKLGVGSEATFAYLASAQVWERDGFTMHLVAGHATGDRRLGSVSTGPYPQDAWRRASTTSRHPFLRFADASPLFRSELAVD